MSDTPKTDAEAGYYDASGCWKPRVDGECVPADFARQLERELAQSMAEQTEAALMRAGAQIERLQQQFLAARMERDDAIRKCAEVAGPEDAYQDQWFAAKANAVQKIRAAFPDAFPSIPLGLK